MTVLRGASYGGASSSASSSSTPARGSWNQCSDIDLPIAQTPDSQWNCIREHAYTLANSILAKRWTSNWRMHREYPMPIKHSVNDIAAVALREGVAAEPYPAPLNAPDLATLPPH